MRLRTVVLPIAVLAFTLSTGSTRAQTVRKIEIPVKVSDSAVNAFIASQWSSRSWNSFTGSIGGCNYTITVPAPTVDFNPGAATVGLSVTVSSTNCGGPWSFGLSPTLALPSGQVTTAQVKLWMVDLYNLIDGLLAPGWVRDALDRELGGRWGIPGLAENLDAFPAPLLTGLTSDWFEQRSVNLAASNPFELGWQIGDGFLALVPAVNVQAGQGETVAPDFKSRLVLYVSADWIDFWSNIKAQVKTVRIYDLSGEVNYYTVQPQNVFTVKYHGDPSSEWIGINLGDTLLSLGKFYLVWVLFETDDTFYSRQYKLYSDNSFGWHFSTGGYNE